MRAGIVTLLLVGTALGVAACQRKQPTDNITITDNIPANADIEALPPDESSATPFNDLANGTDTPEVNDLNTSDDTY
jgi:hypothetical protein